MKYLVTGGAGFIGSHLVDRLIEDGNQVIVFDDFSTGRKSNLQRHHNSKQIEVKEGSILDFKSLSKAAETCNRIVHLAAAVGVFNIVNEPLQSLRINIRGSENVFDVALKNHVPVLIASSSEVYGKNTADFLSEEDDRLIGNPQKLRWSYSDAKAIDEAMAFAIHREAKIDVRVVRFFNTVGPRQVGKYGMVLPRFVHAALNNEPIEVYGNGLQTRCLAHVRDVVNAVTEIERNEKTIGLPINVGSNQEITILKLAQTVKELTNSSSSIIFRKYTEAYTDGFEDMQRRVPDLSRLRQLTSWKPLYGLEDAIRDIIDHMKKENDTQIA